MDEIRELVRQNYFSWAKENNTSFDKLKVYSVPQLTEMYGLKVSYATFRKVVSSKNKNYVPNQRTVKELLTFFKIPFVVKNGGIELLKP
jgi:hypothetical protein